MNCKKLSVILNADLYVYGSKEVECFFYRTAPKPQFSNAKKDKGIILPLSSNGNYFVKMLKLLTSMCTLQLMKYKLNKLDCSFISTYAVYPEIDHPVFVYELGTSAEEYAKSYILPQFKGGVIGTFRKVLSYVFSIHPSTACIVIVIPQ
jgi:hypothetical protein